MASVTGPTPASRYHDGQGNKILSIARVETIMVRYVDPDGKESMAQIQVFGEADYGKSGSPDDRMPGVWVIANLAQLQEKLRLAPREQAKAILASMEEKGLIRDGKLISAEALASASLPDVSAAFEELEEPAKP